MSFMDEVLARHQNQAEPPIPRACRPLSDSELARLLIATAAAVNVHPVDIWVWCDLLTIEAIRSGDPVEIKAFKACVESALKCGTLRLDGRHSLPFPGGDPYQGTTTELVRCCDCRHAETTNHPALIRCGAGVQAPGACGLWWHTDQHQCGQFERGIQR